jgi:transcription elongation GreA/GreB family factor
MSAHRIEITGTDAQRLRRLLACLAQRPGTDRDTQALLRHTLEHARIVSPGQASPHGVGLHSRAVVVDEETWERMTYTLVPPERVDQHADALSILTRMGLAMLGRREGDVVEWGEPDARHRIRIQRVLPQPQPADVEPPNDHSRRRVAIARRIAAEIDPGRFGVRAIYVFGSTVNGTAGPCSDINLLIHLEDDHIGRRELEVWLEGWSLGLAQIHASSAGCGSTGLLDVHFVTDEDFRLGTTYTAKIGAVTDAAQPLALGARSPGNIGRERIREPERLGLFDG